MSVVVKPLQRVNGRNIIHLQGLDTKVIADLTSDDVITNEDDSLLHQASNWSVTISPEETYHAGPIISFPRLYLTFIGEKETLEKVIGKLDSRTLPLMTKLFHIPWIQHLF